MYNINTYVKEHSCLNFLFVKKTMSLEKIIESIEVNPILCSEEKYVSFCEQVKAIFLKNLKSGMTKESFIDWREKIPTLENPQIFDGKQVLLNLFTMDKTLLLKGLEEIRTSHSFISLTERKEKQEDGKKIFVQEEKELTPGASVLILKEIITDIMSFEQRLVEKIIQEEGVDALKEIADDIRGNEKSAYFEVLSSNFEEHFSYVKENAIYQELYQNAFSTFREDILKVIRFRREVAASKKNSEKEYIMGAMNQFTYGAVSQHGYFKQRKWMK